MRYDKHSFNSSLSDESDCQADEDHQLTLKERENSA